MSQGHTPASTYGNTTAPTGGSRKGLWTALACAGCVIVLLLLAVTGGVAYLVLRDGGQNEDEKNGGQESSTAALARFESDHFSFSYPQEWIMVEDDPDFVEAGGVVEVMDEQPDPDELFAFAPNSMSVYHYASTQALESECAFQSAFLSFGWDESGELEQLSGPTLGGEVGVGYRVSGTHEGQDAVAEGYCFERGGNVVQVSLTTHGGAELSPELTAIRDSWSWAG